jgi:hypothetical protein
MAEYESENSKGLKTKEPTQNNSQEEADTEEISYELGDHILIQGGRYDKLRGRIYYIDDSLIRILPDSVSDRLVDIAIVDGDFDPALGIETPYSISKRKNPAFVAQIDAHVGEIAETFGANGDPGIQYTIKAVDERNDRIILADETGAEFEFEFEFRGIPQEAPFEVLRPRQPLEVPGNGLTEEEEAMIAAEEDEKAAQENGVLDEFEDVLEVEIATKAARLAAIAKGVDEMYNPSASESIYPDITQRNDMFQSFILALPASAQTSVPRQQEIRRLIEQCISLRNSVVEYGQAGEPIGQKQTSFLTVAELIEKAIIPLARPVLDANRVLYLDRPLDERENSLPTQLVDVNLDIKYLSDTVKDEVNFMETQLGGITSMEVSPDSLPAWYLSWETIYKQYNSPWTSNDTMIPTYFREDKDFFRGLPRVDEPDTDALLGALPNNEELVVPDSAPFDKIPLSVMRGLGPRSTRLRPKEAARRVESGEEAAVINTLLFPLSEQRDLGARRSGLLAKDIAMNAMQPQTMRTILERLEGIPDVAMAGGIVSVGQDGNTNGNIPLEEWLQAQPIYPLGLADALVDLTNYGFDQVELNKDQYDVIVKRIDMYRALIKQYIIEVRDASAKSLSQIRQEQNPFLTGDSYKDILDILQGEPILSSRIEEIQKRLPAYKENDIAIFAALFATSPDLVLTVLAEIPGPLARERNRKVRYQFLETLRNAMAKANKRLLAGDVPTPNKCEHVIGYAAVQKVKDDRQRMELLSRFLAKYRGEREENWFNCILCKKHLMCYHEFLLLQEILHPREKDILHKELLLNFSGGQFQGKFMCNTCGQPISSLEFDNSLEFSDDGAPISGRAVLETKEVEVEEIMGPEEDSEKEPKQVTPTQKMVLTAAKKIFDMVGIYPVEKSINNIVQRVESEISKQPSRDDYQNLTKGRKAIDYDIIISRVLVCSTAVNVLIEIQTNIPGYIMRYRMPGCRAGFSGHPVGNPKDRTGIEYIACAVAAIKDTEPPWTSTGFQGDAKRIEKITALMDTVLNSMLTSAAVQQQISMKREYLEEKYGSVTFSEQLPEKIPAGFLPAPYNLEAEEVKSAAIVPHAATPAETVRAWILQSHQIGKENGAYMRGRSFVEAICCKTPVQQPGEFWKTKAESMAVLPMKSPPLGPTHGHAGLHFHARPKTQLESVISEDVMYRIFLKVCYDGPRIGLPHEPGYTKVCIHCGFTFPESPYELLPSPPTSADSKTQAELAKAYKEAMDARILKGKAQLLAERVDITPKRFEQLIDTTHLRFKVDVPKPAVPPNGMKLMDSLRVLDPPPFQGWREIITATMEQLAKLPPGADESEIAVAYGPISNMSIDIFAELEERIGKENTEFLKNRFEAGPIEASEIVWTYILLPFQRIVSGFNMNLLQIGEDYLISEETKKDIMTMIIEHLKFMTPLSRRATGLTLHKMKWANSRLFEAIKILKTSIRGSLMPGGSTGLLYFVSVLLGGILVDFVNPNYVPPSPPSEAINDIGGRAPMQILDVCIQKMRQESLNFTTEQIRNTINERTDKEKRMIIDRFDVLTPEALRVEKMKMKLGLGDWAVSMKAVRAYDDDQYLKDRNQREKMGFNDFIADGINYDNFEEGLEETGGDEDGYDNLQQNEDE